VFGALTSAGSSQTPLLYVVDTDHQDQDNKAQVLVVDPQQKAIVKTYPAGYHPMWLSHKTESGFTWRMGQHLK